jgi:pro-kumamolisin-like protein/Big-like domain-containing protein
MRPVNLSLPRLLWLPALLLFASVAARSQTVSTPSRIVDRVDDNARVTLRGNTHPLAQPQFDRGAAPPDLPMARMLLVLKRGDAQEAALEKLLDDQQDLSSPSYHQWLTPDQFGQQFGPSDDDVQKVSLWLGLQGFQIGAISRGRAVIEFSGTAQQVQQAFHTEIHSYTVNGEQHWANASDPQIPGALAPVVVGINSLHNFQNKPLYRLMARSLAGGTAGASPAPQTTLFNGNACPSNGCYFVSPYDFATIYNVLPLWNSSTAIDGTGQSIAIINRTDINIQDVRDFRNLFGLPANDPQIVLNGPDPGVTPDETEADLDVEWSGAVAKGATIDLVIAASTNASDGVDLAAFYAVDNNVAPVISESFGQCELFIGSTGNSFQNAIRQQAAAQGITFINSTGDQGSAVCDDVDTGAPPSPAVYGLAVSGLASTPYGVAVGGTDFLNFGPKYNFNVPSLYWNTTNDPQHQASALGYVPETTWNDSCTNNGWQVLGAGSTPEAVCNNSQLEGSVIVAGGSGGKSSCTTSTGSTPADCTGGYAKPSWQNVPGVPSDGVRDVPDVSLFASNGFMGSAYIICQADQDSGPCSLNSPLSSFVGIGGTSASAPAFAGIMAMVNQSTGSSAGNANYVLYKLASSSNQTSHACNATASPSSGCIFYDVTDGTIAMPCAKGTPNCNFTNGGDLYGVLAGYSATPNYDQATGLGSVNAGNLVSNWIRPANSSTTSLTLNNGNKVNVTHGQNVNFSINVTPSAAPGLVTLMGAPNGGAFEPLASFPLQNGSASGTTTALAGGNSYSVKAHYPGNGTYEPSDSTPITVTVAPEPSKTVITVPVFSPAGAETGDMPTSVVYGTPMGVRVDVGNSQAAASFPMKPVCIVFTCPTGSVAISDSYNGASPTPVGGSGTFTLNPQGFAEIDGLLPGGGTHQIEASYPGDGGYNSSSAVYALTVTPVGTRIVSSNPPLPPTVATPFNVGVILTTSIFGAMPSCDFTFYDGNAALQGTPTCAWQANGPFLYVNLPISQATAGAHTYSAKFNGDSNYTSSTSASMTTQVYYGTTTALSTSAASVQYGGSITLTALIDSAISKSPALPDSVTFYYNNNPIAGTLSYTPTTDSSGNLALVASISFVPQFSSFAAAMFNGDSNYFQSGSTTLDVNVIIPDFSLSASFPSSSITAGSSANATVTVTPVSSASSPVVLTCPPFGQGQPPGISCSFSPSTVNLSNSTAGTSTLSILTLAPSSSTTTSSIPVPLGLPSFASGSLWSVLIPSLVIVLLSLLLPSHVRRNRFAVGATLTCLLLFLGFDGCGGGSSGGEGGGGGSVPTSITLTTSAVKVPSGGAVNLTANVSPSTAGGTVNFIVDGSNGFFVSSQVVNGIAQFQLTSLSVGIHTITAQYSGGTNSSHTTGGLNIAVTGQTGIAVQANTGGLFHTVGINFSLQ